MIVINAKLGDLYSAVGLKKDALSQYFIVADYYEHSDQTDQLLEVRRKIVATDPSAVTSRIRLAEIYQKEGSTDESLREYERAAEDLKALDDKESLISVYERILYYRPDEPRLVIELCQLYLVKGDMTQAQQHLEAISPALQKQAIIMELALDICLRLEQREKARKLIKELYQRYAETDDAEAAVKIYALARGEFVDDEEYLIELDELRQQAGAPISDADLDKTVMVRLDEITPPAAADLDKTVMVRLDEITEEKTDKKMKPQKKPKAPVADLDETVMVNVADLEKQLKKKDNR